MIVFKVLKSAKAGGKWNIIHDWARKIDPAKLSTEPMIVDGREGWCDQALWYNYKGKALIELNKPKEALEFIDNAISNFPKQKKILLRLKALSYHRLGDIPSARECYKELCNVRNPDWWLVHEYARVIIDEGDKERGLKLMCEAAQLKGKLDLKVTLFQEIGLLLKEMNSYHCARAHLSLSALVREDQGWSIPDVITAALRELNEKIGDDNAPKTIKEALNLSRKEWDKTCSVIEKQPKKNAKRGLKGKVSLGHLERQFCFIVDENMNSFFCLKSDLPTGISDGTEVSFTALPSFDKKKNRESWKAVDISLSS